MRGGGIGLTAYARGGGKYGGEGGIKNENQFLISVISVSSSTYYILHTVLPPPPHPCPCLLLTKKPHFSTFPPFPPLLHRGKRKERRGRKVEGKHMTAAAAAAAADATKSLPLHIG